MLRHATKPLPSMKKHTTFTCEWLYIASMHFRNRLTYLLTFYVRSREAARGSYINHITLILFCTEKITMYQSKYSLLHSSAQQFRWTFPCFLHLTKTTQRKYHQTALLNNTSCTSYTLPIFHSVFFYLHRKSPCLSQWYLLYFGTDLSTASIRHLLLEIVKLFMLFHFCCLLHSCGLLW